jgi:hypothetical protein
VALKSEAAQRFVRTVGAKQVQADYPLARLLDVEPSTSAAAGAKSAGQKYLFTAEWRHKGQRASSTSSVAAASAADHSGDCVALKAANGVYCSVERKDGSFSLAYAHAPPHCTVLYCIASVVVGRLTHLWSGLIDTYNRQVSDDAARLGALHPGAGR